ncbi:kinase-like domain-containing protein [Mycena vulgaris]|nr:kinase-like domain-containing protein [Mycena vulgaris]
MSSDVISDVSFEAEVERMRDEDFKLKDASNLFKGLNKMVAEASVLHLIYSRRSVDPSLPPSVEPPVAALSDDPSSEPSVDPPYDPVNDIYIVVYDAPGTRSGNILRLQEHLPWLEIFSCPQDRGLGFAIRGKESVSPFQISDPTLRFLGPVKDSDEDTKALEGIPGIVGNLHLISFDTEIHFSKRSKCWSEIPNLLLVNGKRDEHKNLDYVVKLLGRTDDNQIVFPKLLDGFTLAVNTIGIAAVKRILVQLAAGLIALHEIGIVHRDLALRNILGSSDYQTAYICDLECLWGSDGCPEIADTLQLDISEIPYYKESDVYMFGRLMTDFILRNGVRTRWQGIPGGNWLPPAPFRSIVVACVQTEPSARPTMSEVKALLEDIHVPG